MIKLSALFNIECMNKIKYQSKMRLLLVTASFMVFGKGNVFTYILPCCVSSVYFGSVLAYLINYKLKIQISMDPN